MRLDEHDELLNVNSTGGTGSNKSAVSRLYLRLSQTYQSLLDKWTPHTRLRWAFAILLVILFGIRIVTQQGWYIVTYALGIYHLNLFIAFLTPKIDPAMDLDTELNDDGPALPTRSNEEFRPFIRRLPEFKFWYSVTKSTCIALICTLFDCFNIPVFWPILVMYFFTLLCITMKRQIRHMIDYKYLPFTHGKPQYNNYNGGSGSGSSSSTIDQSTSSNMNHHHHNVKLMGSK